MNIETRARCKSSSKDGYSAQFMQFSDFLNKRKEKILQKKTFIPVPVMKMSFIGEK